MPTTLITSISVIVVMGFALTTFLTILALFGHKGRPWLYLSREHTRALFTALIVQSVTVCLSLVASRDIRETQSERDKAYADLKEATNRLAQLSVEQKKVATLANALSAIVVAVDPSNKGPDAKVKQVLPQLAETIQQMDPSDPLVQAELLVSIGQAYQDLGDYEESEKQSEMALAKLTAVPAQVSSANLLYAYNRLFDIQFHRAQYEKVYKSGIQLLPSITNQPPNFYAGVSQWIAFAAEQLDKFQDANLWLDKTLASLEKAGLSEDQSAYRCRFARARIESKSNWPKSKEDMRRILETAKVHLQGGSAHVWLLGWQFNYGELLASHGEPSEGLAIMKESYERTTNSLGDFPDAWLRLSKYALALSHQDTNAWQQVDKYLATAAEHVPSDVNPAYSAEIATNRATFLMARGDNSKADVLLTAALADASRAFGHRSRKLNGIISPLVEVNQNLGRKDRAEYYQKLERDLRD